MKAPAVSGAQEYKELCVAAKNEERRLNELNKRQQYLRDSGSKAATDQGRGKFKRTTPNALQGKSESTSGSTKGAASNCGTTHQKRCYICNSPNHLANQCRASKAESTGKPPTKNSTQPATRQITTQHNSTKDDAIDPIDLLLSDPEDNTVRQIRITDHGSEARSVKVGIQGVPAYGVIDTAADITIMGGKLFKEVASVARLRI